MRLLFSTITVFYFFFFFNDTATTEIYTLSLHDALPISRRAGRAHPVLRLVLGRGGVDAAVGLLDGVAQGRPGLGGRLVVEAADHVGRHLARDLAGRVAAHPVGDDEERALRGEQRRVGRPHHAPRVLVDLAHAALVGLDAGVDLEGRRRRHLELPRLPGD